MSEHVIRIVIPRPRHGSPKQLSRAKEIVERIENEHQEFLRALTPEQIHEIGRQSADFWVAFRNRDDVTFLKKVLGRKRRRDKYEAWLLRGKQMREKY